MAVVLDVPAWTRAASALRGGSRGHRRLHGASPADVAWLTSHGWRAVDAGPRDSVPSVWQELGAAPGRRRPPTRLQRRHPGRAPENIVMTAGGGSGRRRWCRRCWPR